MAGLFGQCNSIERQSAKPKGESAGRMSLKCLQGRSEYLPARSEGLPARSEGLPARSEGLPARSEGLPAWSEGLPARYEGLSARSEGLSAWSEGLLAWSEGLPSILWKGGGTNERTDRRMDGRRKISPFYRTSSPTGVAAQKREKPNVVTD